MPYNDFTEVRGTVLAPEDSTNSIFTQLLIATVSRIHALQYFRIVGPIVRITPTMPCPACIVMPIRISPEVAALNTSSNQVAYDFDVGLLVKDPNEARAMQQALFYIQKIRESFQSDGAGGILTFGSISEHLSTEVLDGDLEISDDLGNNVLAYNTGVTIRYLTWENN